MSFSKKLIPCFVFATVLLSSMTYSDEISKRKLVEDLLATTKVQQTLENALVQSRQMQKNTIKQMGIKTEQAALADTLETQIMAVVNKYLSWENMKKYCIDAYMSTLTEKEIVDILAFYKSEAGQKFISKMPELTHSIMNSMQQQSVEMTKEVLKVREEFLNKHSNK